MDAQIAETVLALFDQIAATTDEDVVRSAAADIRHRLDGGVPSILLKEIVFFNTNEMVRTLTEENAALTERVEELSQSLSGPQPVKGTYSLAEFHTALFCAMGRSKGWRIGYVEATERAFAAGLECKAVKDAVINQWQSSKRVPDWAYEQISRLEFSKCKATIGAPWTKFEYDRLVEMVLANPSISNEELSIACTAEFKRPIGVPAIKSAIDRRRKKGELPLLRPGRTKRTD